MKSDSRLIDYFYVNLDKVSYYDGFMFGLNEVTSDFYEYHRGQSEEETLLSGYIYTAYLGQGLKQTRLVY